MDEGQINLLWIEDQVSRFAVDLANTSNRDNLCFRVKTAGTVEELLSYRTRGQGGTAYPDFDVAVCDFSLIADEFSVSGVREAGLQAQAAGVMIGILLALRQPHRPRGIVPYSGSAEQFGDNWRLLRSYLPESIVLAEEFEAAKLTQDRVFRASSEAFRESILVLSDAGRIHFSDETVRWLLEAAGGRYGNEDSHRLLDIVYPGGVRGVNLAALFYDAHVRDEAQGTHDRVARALTDFVYRLDLANEDMLAARRLAGKYWRASMTDASDDAHKTSTSAAPDPTPRDCAVWLKTEDGSDWVKACAAIELCLRAYVETMSVVHALEQVWLEVDDASTVGINDVVSRVCDSVEARPTSFFARCLEDVVADYRNDMAYQLELLMDDLSTKQASRNPATLWEERWAKALDPIPKRGQVVRNVGANERLGQGIKRLFAQVGEPDQTNVAKGIAKGIIQGASVLPPNLMTVARRYAFELIPPNLPWPSFLSRGGKAL